MTDGESDDDDDDDVKTRRKQGIDTERDGDDVENAGGDDTRSAFSLVACLSQWRCCCVGANTTLRPGAITKVQTRAGRDLPIGRSIESASSAELVTARAMVVSLVVVMEGRAMDADANETTNRRERTESRRMGGPDARRRRPNTAAIALQRCDCVDEGARRRSSWSIGRDQEINAGAGDIPFV